MLVGDLIYNDDFDANLDYAIYDCTEDGKQWHNAEVIHSTKENNHRKPLDRILDMKVKYLTIENNCLIIEARKGNT